MGLGTLTAHGVMLGEGTSAVGFATIGTAGRILVDQGAAADPSFSSTGLTVTQWSGSIITANPSSGTATLNLALGNRFFCTLVNGVPTTLVLSNPTVGQPFSILLIQDVTGSGTVGTWFSGIKWAGGAAPTLTTAASKGDLATFLCVSTVPTGVYWGMMAGQNFLVDTYGEYASFNLSGYCPGTGLSGRRGRMGLQRRYDHQFHRIPWISVPAVQYL